MKIVIDARTLSLSTGRYVGNLINYLQDVDGSNQYIVLLLKKDFDKWNPESPNFHKLVADYPIYSLSEQIQFASLLYGLKADLVHFAMPQHPLLYFKKHVVTIHDLTLIDFVNKRHEGVLKDFLKNVIKPLVFKILMRWTAIFASAIITPTKFVSLQVTSRLGARADRVHVTYEAADRLTGVTSGKRPDFVSADESYLLFVGNAYPYKNLDTLVEAFQRLSRPNLKLILVGKTDYFYEQLRRKLERENIGGVILTGFVADDELAWLYEHAKVYIFPSLSEGFGLPGLEAMQYNLPVIAADASCLPEVYRDAALYFDPRSSADLAEKIGGLLDDEGAHKKLVAAGHDLLQRYSWKKMAHETLRVYEQAAGR